MYPPRRKEGECTLLYKQGKWNMSPKYNCGKRGVSWRVSCYHFLCFHWVLGCFQFTPVAQRWKQEPKPQEAEKLLVFLPLELIPKCTLGSRGFFSCAAGCFVPGAKALVTVKTVTGLTQTMEGSPGERKVACSIPWNGRPVLRVLVNWGRKWFLAMQTTRISRGSDDHVEIAGPSPSRRRKNSVIN